VSLLKSIAKIGKGVIKSVAGSTLGKVAASVIPGVGPVLGTVLGTAAGAVLGGGKGGGGGKLPPLGGLPSLPAGGGKIVGLSSAGAAVMGAAGSWLYDAMGNPVHKKRRRKKGISAKDLTSFKRVARLVDKYAKPVHHFRNIKK